MKLIEEQAMQEKKRHLKSIQVATRKEEGKLRR